MSTADQLGKLLDLVHKIDRASSPVLDADGFWFTSRPGFGVLITTNAANTARAESLAKEFQALTGGGSERDCTRTALGWSFQNAKEQP